LGTIIPCTEKYSPQGILSGHSQQGIIFCTGNPCAKSYSKLGIPVPNYIPSWESLCPIIFLAGNHSTQSYSKREIPALNHTNLGISLGIVGHV